MVSATDLSEEDQVVTASVPESFNCKVSPLIRVAAVLFRAGRAVVGVVAGVTVVNVVNVAAVVAVVAGYKQKQHPYNVQSGMPQLPQLLQHLQHLQLLRLPPFRSLLDHLTSLSVPVSFSLNSSPSAMLMEDLFNFGVSTVISHLYFLPPLFGQHRQSARYKRRGMQHHSKGWEKEILQGFAFNKGGGSFVQDNAGGCGCGGRRNSCKCCTGRVRGINAGECSITAKVGKKKYTCLVEVTKEISEESLEKPTKEPDTGAQVYDAILAMQSEYPEGMVWTNDNSYNWKGGIYSGGMGCAAFAFAMSDAAFGELPARVHTDYADIRAGDILRVNDNTHFVIVLEVFETEVVVDSRRQSGTAQLNSPSY